MGQPDLIVVCDPAKLDQRGCRGAPDFAVEVLSPSTSARDQVTKRDLYEQHGVREYWVVHPTERTVRVHHRGEDGRYGDPLVGPASGSLGLRAVPELRVDWDVAFDRCDRG